MSSVVVVCADWPSARRASLGLVPISAHPPASVASGIAVETFALIKLPASRSTATKAWHTLSGALPSGTPAPVEVVTFAVHDNITLKFRDRDAAGASYVALLASPMRYRSSKGNEVKANAIRVKLPANRRPCPPLPGGGADIFHSGAYSCRSGGPHPGPSQRPYRSSGRTPSWMTPSRF